MNKFLLILVGSVFMLGACVQNQTPNITNGPVIEDNSDFVPTEHITIDTRYSESRFPAYEDFCNRRPDACP